MILAVLAIAAAPQSATCANLSSDYENASRRLAMSFSESLVSRSPRRRADAEARDANILAEASQTLELMKSHKCDLPTATPKAGYYLVPAIECQRALLRQSAGDPASPPPACDMSKWQRTKEEAQTTAS